MFVWEIIILIILLFLSGVFSASEVALVSLGHITLRKLTRKNQKGSKYVKKLKSNPDRMIITILIGNNLVNISASVLATLISTELFGSKGAGIAVGIMTFLVLVFGEITPKAYAATHPEKLSLIMAKPLLLLKEILLPIIIVLEWLTNQTLKLFGSKKKKKKRVTEEELKIAIDIGAEEQSIRLEEKILLKNVLKFNDITAKEVMTKRQNIFGLDANMSVKNSIKIIAHSPFSRIPLFLGSLDNIVGIIHTKDLLEAISENKMSNSLRDVGVKPFFVKENIIIDELFKLFQETHRHIAIVVGLKGETTGMITIEDLLEELVGEIIDESDVTPNKIMRIDKKTILVDGETSPKYINSFFQTGIPDNFETLSDFIIAKNKRLPFRGEELKIHKHKYYIEEVGDDYIERVVIKRK